MPSRIVPFVNGEFYHVFNRGVAKMQIFNNYHDYYRFMKTALYYQLADSKPRFSIFAPETMKLDKSDKIVDTVCYCLMPNHFHFLLKQLKDGGITEFVSKLSNSYTRYFNVKNKRVGPLLQGNFKSVHVETNEQLLHLSRYIHLNPLIGYVTKNLENFRWSSYREYIGLDKIEICSKDIVLNQFKTRDSYKQFVLDNESYARELEMIKHQLLDVE